MRHAFKLSVHLRKPVTEVLAMPWWAFAGYAEYFAKSPHPEDRVEAYLIRISQQIANMHKQRGDVLVQYDEARLFKADPWETQEDADKKVAQSIFAALMGGGSK